MSGSATTAAAATGLASFTTVLSFAPFGVSMETAMLGGGCFLLGVAARAGGILFRKLDGTQEVGLKDVMRPFAAALCMIPVAAAASCIVFLGAALSNVHADAGCGGVLLVLGIRGLEGFQWISNRAADIFMRFAPGPKPGGDGP